MGAFRDWLLGPALEAPQRRADETPPTPTQGAGVKPPARNASKRSVKAGDALGLSMVYRAISIHATSGKQLSIDAHKGGEIVDRPTILASPSADMTRSAFIETAFVSLAATGNAYWRKLYKSNGTVSSLEPLNPLDVTINQTTRGTVTSYGYTGRQEPFTPDEIVHSSLLRVPGTAVGLGPIQAAQTELRGALDQSEYAHNWFDRGGNPTGILKTDQHINSEQAAATKAHWNETAGAKQGVAVIGNGLDYKPIYMSPKDVQFIESQQFTTTQIARLFGVPASLMLASVEGGSQTYANVEQDWLGYVRFSLMQYLVEIEDALSSVLPRGTEAKFNVEALLRADTTTRYQSHKVALEAGFMTVAEVRDIENLPPLADPLSPEDGDTNV